MHPLIEIYLQRVESQLKDLSNEQRFEEIRELGQHLQSLVEEGQERGLNQNEAVREALAQFGPYRRVGRELNKAGSNSAPARLPKVFSAMTLIMMGWAICQLFTSVANWTISWAIYVHLWGTWGSVWHVSLSLTLLTLTAIAAFALRQLRPWAFWLALFLKGRAAFGLSSSLFFLQSQRVPLQIKLWVFSSLCVSLFCLSVLIFSSKTYLQMARAKRHA